AGVPADRDSPARRLFEINECVIHQFLDSGETVDDFGPARQGSAGLTGGVQAVRLAPPLIPFGSGGAGQVVKVKTSSRTSVMKSRPLTRAPVALAYRRERRRFLRLEYLFRQPAGRKRSLIFVS